MESSEFNPEELDRYSRHFSLPDVGMEGQSKIKAAKILLVGAGGLGSPAALYLAAAGVGTLGIVDFDKVDLSNLHRQVIHSTEDTGRNKVDSAEDRIRHINPHVRVIKHDAALTSENALEIIADYDLVVDGTDNFPTRYLVNDACVLLKKVNVYGSIFRFDGQATVFCAPDGPCYRCLYPEPPPPGTVPSCAEGGVLGVLPGMIGLVQATEALKLVMGIGEPLIGRLMMYDALAMRFNEIKIKRDPDCPACGDHPTLTHLIDYNQFCGIPSTESETDMDADTLRDMMRRGEHFVLLDVREPFERAVASIEGSASIPSGQVLDGIKGLHKNALTVVHCQSGMRSAKASELLRSEGFKNVLNLKGGIKAWMAEGHPVKPA